MENINTSPRVRFAPSPTGHLHIGGVRTALFNYLFARSLNGKFLLRIEDTDLERSTQENQDEILSALNWLGLDSDEAPVIQSSNRDKHISAAELLLENGKAYRCFCSSEKLSADKEAAGKSGEAYRYSGRCRNLCQEEIQSHLDAGDPYTVRFKVPEGITRFKDMVYKKIEVNNKEIGDFIIVRSDGSPIYHLSVVVDDAAMAITHVIRGEDHLSNTPKQILLYLALGYKVPKFAHLPLILGPDGKRLSKRFGATSVDEFVEMGFLPEGLLNGLALLGWGDNVTKPIFDLEQLIAAFDLNRVNKKGAIFDIDKLYWINGQHLSRISAQELWPRVKSLWEKEHFISKDFSEETGVKYTDLLKTRIRSLNDFIRFGSYLFNDPLEYDKQAVEKAFSAHNTQNVLLDLSLAFKDLEIFSKSSAESVLRELAEKNNIKAADYIHPMRLAVTGFGVSPDIFNIMEYIGKESVVRRLKRAATVC